MKTGMPLSLADVDNPPFYKENAGLSRAPSNRSDSLANSKSAEKRARQATARRARNVNQRSQARTSIKRVVTAVESGQKDQAAAALKQATPVIDAMARKGIIHKNKAARHKSRLNKRIKALAAQ
jgi:small subunit ribosomal protein S20